MEQLIAIIEKGQPFFNAIARNKYLKAIRDGFISVIPIIIFSSIFCLVASVPNIWGFYWPDDINNALWKCYNYSMGILAIACAATTAKHFADAQNRDLPKNNQINFISCMCAAIIGFLLLSSDTIATDAASGFNTTYLGSKGLLTAFIAAFVTGIIYKFFIKRNITVKMPEQVPPNISQTFKDIIPFSVCITVFWVFDIVFRAAFGFCFAQGVIQVFQPLFTAADGYIGLAVIYGAMSLFWFVGVHGPSIVEPAIAAALVANMTDNLAAFQAGQHASAVLTQGAQYFVVCMGGTGATLVLVFMFCFLAKSQEMRAVGKAAIVPVCFAVNEPLLFAAPIVLNPVFFVPFVFAPIANIWILKIFIDFLGMNGFMYTLPWTVPGPIGTIMGLGFQPLAFVMLALILVVDFVLYYPFFRAYDAQKCAEEAEISQEELAAKNAETLRVMNQKIRDRELKKYYLCIVHGTLPRPAGRLEGYILKDEAKKQVTVSSRPRPGAKTAVTLYETLAVRNGLSLVRCQLITGRTHQIRAQFAAAGHPLLGDGKYGSERQNKRYGRSYQALYSYRLEFCFTTDAGALAPLDGQQFQVEQVDFVTEYFPGFSL